jgi:hypothetical protein
VVIQLFKPGEYGGHYVDLTNSTTASFSTFKEWVMIVEMVVSNIQNGKYCCPTELTELQAVWY